MARQAAKLPLLMLLLLPEDVDDERVENGTTVKRVSSN